MCHSSWHQSGGCLPPSYQRYMRAAQANRYQVRPGFILAIACLAILFTVPDLIARRPLLQEGTLLISVIAVGCGWVWLIRDREKGSTWRKWASIITAAYLTASIPAFLFEMRRRRLLNPAASAYVRPWVHHGYLLVCLGVLASFCLQGRRRLALLLASMLLFSLRTSMGTWAF